MKNIFKLQDNKKLISYWLISCLGLILFIILIGGITRLTNSGLSIVEWKPITGIIPPLTNNSWLIEFSKYQNSAEYHQIHYNMTLDEFKFIYFLEYFHRLLGRIVSLVFFIPLIFFLKKDLINPYSKKYYALATILLLMQGVVGWYMVKSGLSKSAHISHYRLALHLMLAIFIYSILFCQLMNVNKEIILLTKNKNLKVSFFICIFSLVITYLQIILGGLLAGLKGGQVYNSFPLMGDHFIAPEIYHNSWQELILFNDPVVVQFAHRINAFLLAILILGLFFSLIKTSSNKLINMGYYTLLILLIQFTLGILTLVYSVPINLALLHQFGSLILLSCLLKCYCLLKEA